MAGPPPKLGQLRQRRNRVTTAATLDAEPRRRAAPKLPADHPWREETRVWWRDVWRSPMAGEYTVSDRHGLLLLARLVDRFWTEPTTALASEIRLQGQLYGLSPLDRRRLQWEVGRGEEAERKRSRPKPPPRPDPSVDPRSVLQVVS